MNSIFIQVILNYISNHFRDYENKSILMNKYRELLELFDRMTRNIVKRRPESCHKILEDQHLWAFNKKECEVINIIKKFCRNRCEECLNNLLNQISHITKHLFLFKKFYSLKYNNNNANAIIITNDDQIYGLGYNCEGVLGFGHENEVKELTIVSELCNKGIVDFKNSISHTIAQTCDGKLYSWGSNAFGILGNGEEDWELYKPKMNQFLKDKIIIEISCGINHTIVLTNHGEVYGWGDNRFGQIGNRKSGEDECEAHSYFINEFNGEKVISISCGGWHSLALTQSGNAYSWGQNKYRQLGRNTSGNMHSSYPKQIEIIGDIIFNQISCGPLHSLLLSRDGNIYVFGSNSNSELGIITTTYRQIIPIQLSHTFKFKQIASHNRYCFSCALSINGLYYIWGKVSEKEIIRKPKETQFKSFNEIFINYFGITY